jgi:ABC-2 type transport system permease protein
MYALPFASMQNTPFLIYTGYMDKPEALKAMLLQLIWLAVLVSFGYLLMKKALKKVVVQGG